jgi:hypothetical protein
MRQQLCVAAGDMHPGVELVMMACRLVSMPKPQTSDSVQCALRWQSHTPPFRVRCDTAVECVACATHGGTGVCKHTVVGCASSKLLQVRKLCACTLILAGSCTHHMLWHPPLASPTGIPHWAALHATVIVLHIHHMVSQSMRPRATGAVQGKHAHVETHRPVHTTLCERPANTDSSVQRARADAPS